MVVLGKMAQSKRFSKDQLAQPSLKSELDGRGMDVLGRSGGDNAGGGGGVRVKNGWPLDYEAHC